MDLLRLDPSEWWQFISERERQVLGGVYRKILAVNADIELYVRYALYIEIIVEYDHRSWDKDLRLSGSIWAFQEFVTSQCEVFTVDRVQRSSYFRLVAGGQNRHDDVAYGLSEKLLLSNKEHVISELLSMGKRTYKGRIPKRHEMENGVLHVAVSYRHSARFWNGGTISERQAQAIWTAIKSMPLVTESTYIRVWVDQNLHRKKFRRGSEWYEYGLLPYACLPVVFIGEGDCSVRPAYTRPWIWVEMLTALKASGIHTVPGINALANCDSILFRMENYEEMRPGAVQYGWWMGPRRNVDAVMSEIAICISLWRRTGFLGHSEYEEEYAIEFEKFVNWARWFVIRGVKYSEMSWNHSSHDVVRGMDAVVLLRAMPREEGVPGESVLGLVRPNISWRSSSSEEWIIEDLFDRTEIGDLPLSALIGFSSEERDDFKEVLVFGKEVKIESIRFRKQRGIVSLFHDKRDTHLNIVRTNNVKKHLELEQEHFIHQSLIKIAVPQSLGSLMTYVPFTGRTTIAKGRVQSAIGDATLMPALLEENVEQDLELKRCGLFYHNRTGLCEAIYEVTYDRAHVFSFSQSERPQTADESYSNPSQKDNMQVTFKLATSEVMVLFKATKGDLKRFQYLVDSLKRNTRYKLILYKDMSHHMKLVLSRGWKIGGMKFDLDSVSSGERNVDIGIEFIEKLRGLTKDRCLVFAHNIDATTQQIVFRMKRELILMKFRPNSAQEEVIAVSRKEVEEFGTDSFVRLLRQLCEARVSTGTSDAGPASSGSAETAHEISGRGKLMKSLFVKCGACKQVVCPLNGLVAKIGAGHNIRWIARHDCYKRIYLRQSGGLNRVLLFCLLLPVAARPLLKIVLRALKQTK